MPLSENIRILRKKTLMTQEDFAKELDVAPSTVNRWETGKSRPNLTAMKKLKSFCTKYNFPYERIENEWLGLPGEEL